MSFGTSLVVIFAIACFTWLKCQRQRGLIDNGDRSRDRGQRGRISSREHELEEEVERLRERITVLERIATDERRGKDLAREIEALRD